MQEALKSQLDQGIEAADYMINSEEVLNIIKGTAKLTAVFHDQLIANGITPEAAVVITAGYAANVGKVT